MQTAPGAREQANASSEHRVFAIVLIAAAACYLALGFLYGATSDEEEYRISVLTTLLHARAIAQGVFPFWTSELALGLPHPLGQNFVAHPLMPLLAVLSPGRWVQLFYTLHLIVGIVGWTMLARRLGGSWLATALVVVTLTLAAPSQNFVLSDFWPSGFSGWTLVPLVIALLLSLIESQSDAARARAAVAAGLTAGIAFGTGHPGYMLVYVVPMAAFFAPHLPAIRRDIKWWALACGIATLLALPTVLHVALESVRFPPDLPRLNYEDPLRLRHFWDLFVRPLPIGLGASPDVFDLMLRRGTRVPYAAPPVALLAIAGLFVALRRPTRRLDVVAAFIVSAVLIATPGLSALKIIPATSLFRDPLVLFATLLAGASLDALRARAGRAVAMSLVLVQAALIAVTAWPFLARTFTTPLPRRPDAVFGTGGPVSNRIEAYAAEKPGRILMSSRVYARTTDRGLYADGLWRNAAAFRGLRIANGVFKGISVDELSPSASLLYGHLGAEPPTQLSAALLGMLGIRYVLAEENEPVAAELSPVLSLPTSSGAPLTMYEFADGRAGAHLFRIDLTRTPSLARLPGCAHHGLLCADVSPMWSQRLVDPIVADAVNGRITVRVQPANHERLAIIGEMYRPAWQAEAAGTGARLHVSRELGALIGVAIPAGTRDVTLTYRPLVLEWAWVGWAGGWIGSIAVLIRSFRRRAAIAEPRS